MTASRWMRRWPVSLLLLAAVVGCAPRLQAPGPLSEAPAAPRLDDAGFTTADGVTLPVRRWLPDGEPSAVVVALHGFNDYSNAFEAPAGWLAAHGVAVYAYDQRGFGATAQRGIWPGAGVLVEDAKAMARLVRGRHPGLPSFLLGDSMGAAVVMVALAGPAPPPHDGAILVSPAVWSRAAMPAAQAAGLDFAAHLMPWLPVDGRRFKRRPSDNVEMLKALGRDPLVLKYNRIDTVYGLVNLMDRALAGVARLDGRVLILMGAHEDIIPKAALELMLKRLPEPGAEAPRVAVYDTGYHMLLRDLQAENALTDILHWLGDRAAPLPSGAETRGAARLAAARRQHAEDE